MTRISRPARRRLLCVLTASLTVAGIAAAPSLAAPVHAMRVSDPATLAALRAEASDGTLAATHGTRSTCAAFGCRSFVVTSSRGSTAPLASSQPIGWGATELEQAFRLTNAPNPHRLVAIIGVGAYPKLESDLNHYRKQFGIAPCTTKSGCLTIANYKGNAPLQPSDPSAEEDLAVETSLDVQMVSAACPSCHIAYLGVPVRSNNTQSIKRFGIATRTAARLGAASVSISYGFNTKSSVDNGALSRPMVQPGLGLFSAVGDFGYMNPRTFQTGIGGWPQNLRSVVSVGGTTMKAAATTPTGYAQRAWSGAGSGCAPDLAPAYGQPARIAGFCNGHRAVSDIAAVADGLAVYDTYAPASGQPYGWIPVGGTSASSPFVAGMAARAGVPSDAVGPNFIYRAPSSAFVDITVGRNGALSSCKKDGVDERLCTTAVGWDGATGRGIPRGLAPFGS